MKIRLQCFHEKEFKGYEMKELAYLETNSITFRCVECDREVILFMEFEK